MTLKWKTSPELNDGDHYGILHTPQQVADTVQAWASSLGDDDRALGDGFTVQAVEMSEEEYDALQEMDK